MMARAYLSSLMRLLFDPKLILFVMMTVLTIDSALAQANQRRTQPRTFSNYGSNGPADPVDEGTPSAGAPGDMIGVTTDGAYVFFTSNFQEEVPLAGRKNMALQLICEEGYFTERVVYCIRNIIDTSVATFLTEFELMLNSYILGLIMLAVTLYGGQVLMGTIESPGPDAFKLLLKIGAVLFFTNALGGFLPMLFPFMETLASYGMSYISEGSQSPFLASCGDSSLGTVSIWRRIDCIVSRLLTGNTVADGTGYRAGILWVLAVAIFWTTFLGPFVFMVMFATFMMIFLLVFRCVFVFLSAYTLLAILTIISPLIIPLVLFKSTEHYFQKWLNQFMSTFVQPLLLFAYMAFVFALIDGLFFKDEPYSLVRVLGVGWETPEVLVGYRDDVLDDMMEVFEEDTGYAPGTPEYQSHREYLENKQRISVIGNSLLVPEQLITIDIGDATEAIENIRSVPVIGGAASAAATGALYVANKGLNSIASTLVPFYVTRIQPEGRTRWGFLVDMLKFFLIVLIFLPLLLRFTKDIPEVIQRLSSSVRTPGMLLPGEKQAVGTVAATKGAVKGAARGAVTGFVNGGKKGAVIEGVQGGYEGARDSYRDATNSSKTSSGKANRAGDANKQNVHANEGGDPSQRALHKGQGGGGGIGIKSLTNAAGKVAKMKGGKGGGQVGGGGKGCGGKGGGKTG
ncbi:MAG: type IV secretion system protein [Alphaproteobacteria bacterium]|nr:type IV secretion system protein [Alphaproteobacteria bacterium]